MSLPLPVGISKQETEESQSNQTVSSDHGQPRKRGNNHQEKTSPSSLQVPLKKRSALEDLTNASQSHLAQSKQEVNKEFAKDVSETINRNTPVQGLAKDNEMNINKYELEPSSAAVSTSMVPNVVKKPLTLKISPIPQTITTEEASLFKNPLVLKEKISTGGTVLIKRSLSLKKCENQSKSVTFGEKHKSEEAAITQIPLTLNQCTIQEMSHKKPLLLKKVTFREKSLSTEPLSLEKESATEFSFQESSLLQEKHTTQEEVSTSKKAMALQKTQTGKESLLKKPSVFKKKRIIEETSPSKEIVFIKRKCTTQGKVFLKKPLVLDTISEEKSLTEEPFSFQKEPTSTEELFEESSVLPGKHTTQEEMAFRKKPWASQENIHRKDEFLTETVSFGKKQTTNETISRKKPLPLMKKKHISQIMMSICQEMLCLQNMIAEDKDAFFMEPVSFRKKASTKAAILTTVSSPLRLKKKQTTQGKLFLLKKPEVLLNITSEEKSPFKKVLPFKEKPEFDMEFLCQDPSELKGQHTTIQEVSHLKNPLAFQKKTTTEEESHIKVSLEEKPTTEEEFLFQEPHDKPTNEDESIFWKYLNLQETNNKEDSLKKLLTLQEKSATEENSLLKKPSVLETTVSTKETTSIESQLSLKTETRAQGEVFLWKKHLFLQENITNEEAFLIKQPLILQKKSSNEKPVSGQKLSLEKPLTLQDKPTYKEDTFLKDASFFQVNTNPYVVVTAPQSRIGTSNSGTMSSVKMFNITERSSASESSISKSFSSWGKISQKEIISLKDMDINYNDPFLNSEYVKDIFKNMKKREENFILKNYMDKQTDINSNMRAILVNWLVDVQITFQTNHETLYLAVKLVDHYLMKVICEKDRLQLLGSSAFLIAAKFEECNPPFVNDLVYICNDAYSREELLAMELNILETLKYDVNIPVAYQFLRRYSWCTHVSMTTAMLSRFICELTLQEYEFIGERASKLAAGSFLLALYMRELGYLVPKLEHDSGYKTSELYPLVRKLNTMLTLRSDDDRLKVVRSKYSYLLMCEVTKIPPLDLMKLEEILNSSQF